jgi:hypothetical protein
MHTENVSLDDKAINENDINLELSNLNETRTMQLVLDDHQKDILYQRDPMYPGQIFFVESPLQLELIQDQEGVEAFVREEDF